MNFFERQRAARGTTVKLMVLFVAAVISIVAVVDAILAVVYRHSPASTLLGVIVAGSAVTLLIITFGTLTKVIALRGGGAVVAQSVGAVAVDPSTSDPRLRRFVNVVEEMAIASGVPVPRLFVLDHEAGINAFAAGYSPADAAITVTAGALERLDRDELQGVIGHEFSHVLNGDMRLNVRLIGLLNGILLLGLVGLRFLAFGGGRSRDRNGGALAIVAIAFIVLGFVGQFFAGLIKAAVSRQREWLADASAVQFTRQTTGLAGALKKIAGLPAGSQLSDAHGERQVSHMLFGEGKRGLSQLYATHPPLMQRIAALEPGFRPDEVAALSQQWAAVPPDGLAEDATRGLAPAASVASPRSVRVDPTAMTARVATMTVDDLDRGRRLRADLPPDLHRLAGQVSTAVPLVLALLLDSRAEIRERQLWSVRARLGPAVAEACAATAGAVSGLDPLLRLPLVAVAAPQLAARPAADRRALRTALDELAGADGRVTVFEYSLTRLVGALLADADDPLTRSRPGRAPVSAVRDAALTLLAVVAACGNADPRAAQHAFAAAVDRLLPGTPVPFAPPAQAWAALDAGWEPLAAMDPRHKQALVEALVVAIADDGVVQPAEAELLRTACALLRCPLPPLLG